MKLDELDEGQRVRVTVVLRPDHHAGKSALLAKRRAQGMGMPLRRPTLTRRELSRLNAPADHHRRAVEEFARRHGLEVVGGSPARHDLVLEGTARAVGRAFGVRLHHYERDHSRYHSHEGDVRIPAELAGVILAVVGLDGTPLRRLLARGGSGAGVSAPALAEHYRFPGGLDGAGERIAVIALGGGYYDEDLQQYFEELGLRMPSVSAHSLEGAGNRPLERKKLREIVEAYNDPETSMASLWSTYKGDFGETIATSETTMDVQIAGSAANGAEILVFFAPSSASGLYHAIYAAAGLGDDDGEADTTPATVISLSWGWPESSVPAAAAFATENALQMAQAVGVCICCASGDSGSLGEAGNGQASVLYPASSPSVLACGGTQFDGSTTAFSGECTWNSDNRGIRQATGGGVSGAFPIPAWQWFAPVPSRAELNGCAWVAPGMPTPARCSFRGRGVPDVAAYADQIPGYDLVVAGTRTSAGGTSAATPLWAGLVARLSQGSGRRMSWLHELIYHPMIRPALRAVTGSPNRVASGPAAYFESTPGWSACCGLGVPDGTALLERLRRLR